MIWINAIVKVDPEHFDIYSVGIELLCWGRVRSINRDETYTIELIHGEEYNLHESELTPITDQYQVMGYERAEMLMKEYVVLIDTIDKVLANPPAKE